jgi:hypothetical protein
MPTKWLHERPDGSKNVLGIGFEGPGVAHWTAAPAVSRRVAESANERSGNFALR